MTVWRLILAALAFLAGWRAAPATAQELWFSAHRTFSPRNLGAEDWDQLFKPTEAWGEVAARIKVYQFHVGVLDGMSDAEMSAALADLRQRHVALSISINAIAPRPGRCGGVEGYSEPNRDANVIARIKRLGFTPDYVHMDAPVWFGRYDPQPRACHYSNEELIPQVAAIVGLYVTAFPNIIVGEVEPVPGLQAHPTWQADLRALRQGLAAATGARIAFLDTDMSWGKPGWDDALQAVAHFARAEGMQFGMTYNGNGDAVDDAAWVASSRQHFAEVESRLGLIPDHAIIQTWIKLPTHALPITAPDSLSHLLLDYRLPRARIVLSPGRNGASGWLTDGQGRPVAGAAIAVQSIGLDPSQPLPVLRATGTVPAAARTALMLLRVNADCNCAGQNDLLLGTARYRETGGGEATAAISFTDQSGGLDARRSNAGTLKTVMRAGLPLSRITTRPDQSLSVNSREFPVTPGAAFALDVPAASAIDQDLSGSIALLFRNAQGHAVGHAHLNVPAPRAVLPDLVTDADGRFVLPRVGGLMALQRFTYAGRADLRGAVAEAR